MEPIKNIKKIGGFSEIENQYQYRNILRNLGSHLRNIPLEYEPRKKNRYVMEIPTTNGRLVWFVNTEIPQLIRNNQRRTSMVFGRGRDIDTFNANNWVPIRIIFRGCIDYEDDGRGLTQTLNDWFESVTDFRSVTGHDNWGIHFKKNITITQLDPAGVETEKWHLIGCFPSAVSIGGEDSSEIEITLNYDFARIT